MFQRLLAAAAWLLLAFIAFATLSPIGVRPEVSGSADLERFAAYAVLGFLFKMAYPLRLFLVIGIVIGGAAFLEVLQLFTPDRHGEIANAMVKAIGGLAGVGSATLISYYLGRRR